MTRCRHAALISVLLVISAALSAQDAEPKGNRTIEIVPVDKIWAANKVSFDLHTVGSRQYVAYYDEDRNMSVAVRNLQDGEWQKTILPSKLMWDSHNYVAMGLDEAGYIHVSGNMHTHPLCYFRSKEPYDISEMIEYHHMVGKDEESVTYPKFFRDSDSSLFFSYRAGTCGNGNILINRFLPEENRWERYLDKPIFEGIEETDDRAAYHRFVKDSDGQFHFIWIWRWTPMVETSHQICYATSPDLIHWKNAFGKEISLPMRPDNPDVIVDGTRSKGGMHNGRYQIILTDRDEPVIGYIKYDDAGLTQLYLARVIDRQWVSRQVSDWNFRWKFEGGGDQMTPGGQFSFWGFANNGSLLVEWKTEVGEAGYYAVNPNTLEAVDLPSEIESKYPAEVYERISDTPGLSVVLQPGNSTEEAQGQYLLKWESAKKSHGRNAPETIPAGPLSELSVIKISRQ